MGFDVLQKPYSADQVSAPSARPSRKGTGANPAVRRAAVESREDAKAAAARAVTGRQHHSA